MGNVKELYNITKTKKGYELSKVRTDDIHDLTCDVRHVVNIAMKSSPVPFSDYTYEKVCEQLITELS